MGQAPGVQTKWERGIIWSKRSRPLWGNLQNQLTTASGRLLTLYWQMGNMHRTKLDSLNKGDNAGKYMGPLAVGPGSNSNVWIDFVKSIFFSKQDLCLKICVFAHESLTDWKSSLVGSNCKIEICFKLLLHLFSLLYLWFIHLSKQRKLVQLAEDKCWYILAVFPALSFSSCPKARKKKVGDKSAIVQSSLAHST